MADPSKYQRVEDDDPKRCQGVTNKGQCQFKATEGAKFCNMHGGLDSTRERKAIRNFRLTQWQDRINEAADSQEVKSLREEIGIIRLLIEETVNRCKDSTELILYSAKISDLVMKSERLVASCHKLEERTGALLDKTAVLHLATMMVDIVGRNIDDAALLDRISNEFILAVANHQTPVSS